MWLNKDVDVPAPDLYSLNTLRMVADYSLSELTEQDAASAIERAAILCSVGRSFLAEGDSN